MEMSSSHPSPEPSFSKFRDEAEEQERWIDGLISHPRNAWDLPIWSDDLEDPELQKNLRIFGRLVAGAIGLCKRAGLREPTPAEAAPLAARIGELQRRIVLPRDKPLTLSLLLGHRFALEQLLVELGDLTYLRTRAAELYMEPPGTIVTWAELYGKKPPPLFIDGSDHTDTKDPINTTRAMVGQLLAAKEAQDLPIRARRDMKTRVLVGSVLPVVFVAAVLFASVLVRHHVVLWETLAPPVVAAVTGAVLGRFLKLRDDVTRGAQVREFPALFFGQAVVGLVAGLFVSIAAPQLAILKLEDSRALAVLGFAAGFSEAFFLGLVSRVTGESKATTPGTADRSSKET
jgi:hypothetical protein